MSFTYEEFAQILDNHLREKQIERVLKALAETPQRFTGEFRPSTPREKLIQYIIQSREIKFGDACEEVISEILSKSGYFELPKVLESDSGDKLECDLLFESPDHLSVLLVEQKMRDDHDSTKRAGQFSNFEQKIRACCSRYDKHDIHAIMYFVDPSQTKNKKYYDKECSELKASLPSNTTLSVLYGKEFFDHLTNCISPPCIDWATLVGWLKQWKSTARSDALQLVELEKQENLQKLIEIANAHPELISKIARNQLLWTESLIRGLFPTGNGLRKICESLRQAGENSEHSARALKELEQSISRFYVNQEGTDNDRATP